MKLIIDQRVKNENVDQIYENANLDESLSKLDQLNGKSSTLLSLLRDDGYYLLIGGGEEDSYVITLTTFDEKNYTLININEKENEVVEICAGGQYAEYPARFVFQKLMATIAVKLFFQSKEMELDWMED